jgi:hypothetical protein
LAEHLDADWLHALIVRDRGADPQQASAGPGRIAASM